LTNGFGAVPDELRQAAGTIGDAIAGTARMLWQGPSGDYGHIGVQTGWAQLIDQMKTRIDALRDTANEHGDSLIQAAQRYLLSDDNSGQSLVKAGGLLGATGIPGGGTGVSASESGTSESGFINPGIASRLNPNGLR
jgi:hypothetical protein